MTPHEKLRSALKVMGPERVSRMIDEWAEEPSQGRRIVLRQDWIRSVAGAYSQSIDTLFSVTVASMLKGRRK